jgi:phosphomannomutase/phosphoglucomutase
MKRTVDVAARRGGAVPTGGGRRGRAFGDWLLAYLAAALVLLFSLLTLTWLYERHEGRLIAGQVRALIEARGEDLERRAAALQGQLWRLGDDEALRAALPTGPGGARGDEERALAARIPGVLRVRLFAAPDGAVEDIADEELSYAGAEMVRAAADRGDITLLEVHRVNTPDEHLAIAGPVPDADGQRVLGIVHLRLPLSWLPSLGDLEPIAAQFRYRQRVGGRLVVVAAERGGRSQPSGSSIDVPIDGTRLLLSAWPAPHPPISARSLRWLAGVYIPALALLGVVLGLLFRQQQRGRRADPARPDVRWPGAAADAPARPPFFAGADADVTVPEPPAGSLAAAPGIHGPGAQSASAPTTVPPSGMAPAQRGAPAAIFRAYDIRGLIGSEINIETMRLLGLALGSEARAAGGALCCVARDQRPSGESLAGALVDGLRASGCDVLDLGIAPTPLAYFAAAARDPCAAAIVTASHNPAEYNGLKVVLAGKTASGERLHALRRRIEQGDFSSGQGGYRREDVRDAYIAAIKGDVVLARTMKVVVDCGHASVCGVAPALFRALECDVIELDCRMDPAAADERMPDPSRPQNLAALGRVVSEAGADLGLAFDADGDRLGVVDSAGGFIAADRVLMLLAGDLLTRLPGSDIVYDVKCSHLLGSEIRRNGGRPVMWRSGHSFLKAKMQELDAPFGGELSGHICYRERWNGFDDALYAAGRLLEVLSLDPRPSAEVFAELPAAEGTPELFLPVAVDQSERVMAELIAMADQIAAAETITVDGLRVEQEHGWGLARASHTQPGLVFRFQGDDEAALAEIQDLFRRLMARVAPQLTLPF